MATILLFKELNTDSVEQLNVADVLNGESLVNVEVANISPKTSSMLEINVLSGDPLTVELTGGAEGVSYGADLILTTNTRKVSVLLAVTVRSNASLFNPYYVNEPDAFKDLVGTLQAGNSAVGTAVFTLSSEDDPSSGYVVWELLTEDGVVLSAGNCFDFTVRSTGLANIVTAKAVVSVPSDVEPNLVGEAYQLRWSMYHNDKVTYQFENIVVEGDTTVPLGTQPVVELVGDPCTLELVTKDLYDNVGVQIYGSNKPLTDLNLVFSKASASLNIMQKVNGGYYYNGVFDSSKLKPSLVPYQIVWKYWNEDVHSRNLIYSENADLWIINPSVMSAVEDVLAKVNKARTTLYGKPDLLYPTPTVLTWLRRAADMFNGYMGKLTRFTFLNALGGIREYWLLFAEMAALESQYLAEGEKAFDFQGAAIQLTVDQTQYLEAAAAKIQDRLSNEFGNFKTNLIIKGITSGDGSQVDGPAHGLQGAVGITITPASIWNAWQTRVRHI